MRASIISWCLVLSLPALADVYFDDALTAGSAPGRGSRGGSFAAGGWTTSAEDDPLWYELPVATPATRIEFTVSGLSLGPGGTLSGTDHDILTIYQAPSGASGCGCDGGGPGSLLLGVLALASRRRRGTR